MASPFHDVVASNCVPSNQRALNFIQLDLCEVRSQPNAASWTALIFVWRFVRRSKKMLTKVWRTRTAVGAALDVEKVRVRFVVIWMDVAQLDIRRLRISAPEYMQSTSLTSSYWMTYKSGCDREAVRLGEAEGCIKCGLQPRMLGQLCILCNHRFKTGPELRELNAHDSPTLKNCEYVLR